MVEEILAALRARMDDDAEPPFAIERDLMAEMYEASARLTAVLDPIHPLGFRLTLSQAHDPSAADCEIVFLDRAVQLKFSPLPAALRESLDERPVEALVLLASVILTDELLKGVDSPALDPAAALCADAMRVPRESYDAALSRVAN